ncbi:ATP-binding protein [Paraburkholderia acidicola]|uniref:ATP-binding protein n=1 Tax=Paraburkholderia acidicola TaxID=1912599 RepID=A0ABV1LLE4_9BURK
MSITPTDEAIGVQASRYGFLIFAPSIQVGARSSFNHCRICELKKAGEMWMARGRTKIPLGSATEKLLDLLQTRVAASTRSTREGQVTYIIGNNGTGKSRALGALAERLSTMRPARTVACISNSIHDRFKYGDNKRVRYLGARNAPNAVFLSAVDRQVIRLILQAMAIDRQLFGALCETVAMDLTFRLGKDVENQVRKMLEVPPERVKGRRRANTFKALGATRPLSVLRRIAKGTGRFERLTEVQVRWLLQYVELGIDIELDVALSSGTSMNFGQLSTGEQNRMLVLAKVLSVMEQGAVFLIDEPEISLHLHWQMRFHETLMTLLSRVTRFHVVIATHAPVVISEAAKYDPRSQKNLVAILRHKVKEGERPGDVTPGTGEVTLETHSFAEVASHDQLVLRYFQSSPYHAREISVEIADTVLCVAEGVKDSPEAVNLLKQLKATEGLSDETQAQIDEAISLVRHDWIQTIKESELE